MWNPHHTSRNYAIILLYKNYYTIITRNQTKNEVMPFATSMYWWKYHNLTSITTLIKCQCTSVCLGKRCLSVSVCNALTDFHLPFSPSQFDLTGMPNVSWRTLRHVEDCTTTVVLGCHLLLLLSEPQPCPPLCKTPSEIQLSTQMAGPPPHFARYSEKNCCLIMAAVLLLQRKHKVWSLTFRICKMRTCLLLAVQGK